ncbi:MAG: tetratricopeptide repeat protein [Hyphomonadaceae bacterium]|nr:tetratricopeptide repeat protein [Hyphomonadaceae bacterium]
MMDIPRVWFIGAAMSALVTVSCVSGEIEESEPETPPFIDPVILSQNQCSSPPKQVLTPDREAVAATASSFDFDAPFVLPDAVIAHFHYPITTQSDAAQIWFDTGLAHMANFNHDEAIAAFRKAQNYDPDCAMCYWGEGLSFGSNINAPYDPSRGAAGLVAAEAALERTGGISAKEAALIQTLSVRYGFADDASVAENAEAYAEAMDGVARSYPDDKFILALAAEANLDTQPWDYWEASAREPKGRTARTVEMLEAALEIDPDFAPAIHLYIHATEASVDPFRAESFADRLAEQSLGVGHLVHMPSHIYLRLGQWQKSHVANIAAVAADEAYIAGSTNAASYAQVYYPHNVHFLVTNAQLGGDAATALTMAEKLRQLAQFPPEAPNPFGEHVAASTIFTALQFGSDDAVLDLPEPPEAHLFLRTAWHYARGAVFVRQGELALAEQENSKLSALQSAPGSEMYDLYGVPVHGIMSVADLTLQGRILAAKGDMTGAINVLGAATDAQEQLPYMEPTWWYYPTRQTLAAFLLEDGQADRAEREFFKTLIKSPNNAYALYGLSETYAAQGDERSADYAHHLFEEAWIGEPGETPDLSEL